MPIPVLYSAPAATAPLSQRIIATSHVLVREEEKEPHHHYCSSPVPYIYGDGTWVRLLSCLGRRPAGHLVLYLGAVPTVGTATLERGSGAAAVPQAEYISDIRNRLQYCTVYVLVCFVIQRAWLGGLGLGPTWYCSRLYTVDCETVELGVVYSLLVSSILFILNEMLYRQEKYHSDDRVLRRTCARVKLILFPSHYKALS